jgi:HAD superfamily hydrolase (TIGR01509 family)
LPRRPLLDILAQPGLTGRAFAMAEDSRLGAGAPPHRYRFIFFDWDGCLADTLPLWLEGYRAALERRGLEAEDRVIIRELFNDWSGPERFGVGDAGRFVEEVAGYLERRNAEVRLNPHAEEVLLWLKDGGKRTALLTASRRSLVLPVLEARGVSGLLDLVLTLEDVSRYKPDPEVLFKALRLLGAPAAEAMLVGDSLRDIQAGRAAGVATALYLPEHNLRFYGPAPARECNPDLVIRDLRELAQIP